MTRIEMIAYDAFGKMKLSFPGDSRLAAIKFVRETTGMSIKGAKSIVDELLDEFSGKFIIPVTKKAYTLEYKLEEDIPF